MASLSSLSTATNIQNIVIDTFVPIQCNKVFQQMSSDAIAEREQNKKSIELFVKEQLFKRLKF